jgi:hypothetical protein
MTKQSLLLLGVLPFAIAWTDPAKPDPASVAGGSACTLVSTAELERITGDSLEAKPYLYSYPDGKGSTCTYMSRQIQLVLFTGTGSEKRYDEYIEGQLSKVPKHIQVDRTRKPASGVGSSAYYLHPNQVTCILVVKKGLNTFAVSMVKRKETVETIDARLLAAAKIAASRMSLL